MKPEEILRDLGDLDDELILEADSIRFRRRHPGVWAAAAAVLALALCLPTFLRTMPTAQKESELAECPADEPLDASPDESPEESPDESLEGTEVELPPYNLSSGEITVYRPDGSTLTLVDKAAKRVCTVLTIMEPETAPTPEEDPAIWLDFHNGTVLGLYGHDDLASVYTGEGIAPEDLTFQLTGSFDDLENTLAQASENPTETWD